MEKPFLYQRWRDLFFLHWEARVEEIQRTLPRGLEVDVFEGRAYLAIVPFKMRSLRPRGVFPSPGISDFLELNLRTYVRDRVGRSGVWFYSLEANSSISVEIARRFFHLPYRHAGMTYEGVEGKHDYQCRSRRDSERALMDYTFTVTGEPYRADVNSLDYFFVERYRPYAWDAAGKRLLSGRIQHEPYSIQNADATAWSGRLFELNGFEAPVGAPMSVLYSPGVDVEAFAFEEVSEG